MKKRNIQSLVLNKTKISELHVNTGGRNNDSDNCPTNETCSCNPTCLQPKTTACNR